MSPNSSLPVVVLVVHTLAMAHGDQMYSSLLGFGANCVLTGRNLKCAWMIGVSPALVHENNMP